MNKVFGGILSVSLEVSGSGVLPIAKLNEGDYVAYQLKPKQIRMAVFSRPKSNGYNNILKLLYPRQNNLSGRRTPMDNQPHQANAITVASLDELTQNTPEIVERINATPNGGRLFLADPIRLLQELGVLLTPETTQALQTLLGAQDLANNPLRHLYDDFKRDTADPANPIIIRGIVPSTAHPGTMPNDTGEMPHV